MGPLLPISEVLIPLELSGGTQDNHKNQKPLILGLCAVRSSNFRENCLHKVVLTSQTYSLGHLHQLREILTPLALYVGNHEKSTKTKTLPLHP